MSNLSHQARPYAQAVFELALEQDQLAEWSEGLALLADIVQNNIVNQLLLNPKFTVEQLSDVVLALAGDRLSDPLKNFVKLLAKRQRLLVIPTVFTLYEEHRAAREQTLDVTVSSVVELDQQYQNTLREKLTKQLQRQAVLRCEIDETLLGGLLVKVGDKVIDSSVKGQLLRLKEALAG